MSTATTQINITAKDSTAGAFASAERGLSGLASSALKTTAGLAGIGLSIAGAVDAVKGITQATIQFQTFTSTLQVGVGSAEGAAKALQFVRSEANRLGLDLASAADQFAKLTAASKGTALEGKATEELFSAMANASTVLNLSADKTSKALNALQQMISKGKVSSEELRQQLGDVLPGAFQIASRAMGKTTQEFDAMLVKGEVMSEEMIPKLTAEVNKLFAGQAEQAAKGLSSQINRMNTAFFEMKLAIGETGLINFLSSGIELATKLTNKLTNLFVGDSKQSPVQKQITLIKELEEKLTFMQGANKTVPFGDSFLKDFIFSKQESDALKFRIETAKADLKSLEAAAKQAGEAAGEVNAASDPKLNALMEEGKKIAEKYADPLKVLQELQKKYKELLDAGAISQDVYNRALKAANDQYAKPGIKQRSDELNKLNKAQSDALRIESEYVKLLQIEKKQREDLIAPYRESAKQANTNLVQMQDQIAALQLVKDRQITLKEAVELTTIARLNERKASSKDPQVISQINAEIEARKKIADLIPLHAKLEQQTRRTTDQMSQLWIQAGRNIQSQLANSIFIFFEDGLDGMVKSVGNAVARITAEFAALKLAQMTGLSQMFGVGGMSGAGSSPGMLGFGGGMTLASMFGKNPTQLAAEQGALKLWGNSGAATNSTGLMGRLSTGLGGMSAGGALGALGILGASVGMGSSIAGDKKVFGIDGTTASIMGAAMGGPVGAVVAGAINAIFGRSPYKFRQQSLQGTASAEGFEGDFTNVFRSKGGLLSSNKHKSRSQDLTTEQQDVFDIALDGFYTSAHDFAKNLGLSTDLVDNFTKEFSIVSEKNQQLTEEAISKLLIGVGDDIAKNVLPIVDSFRKAGETSFTTFKRLSDEFVGMREGAMKLGASLGYANELLKNSTFEGRAAFVEAAGGLEALAQKTSFFSENFLSDADRFAPAQAALNTELTNLGLSTELTKEQFKDLVQSFGTVNGVSEGMLQSLLNLAPAFINIRNISQQIKDNANQDLLFLADNFAPSERLGIEYNLANEALNKFGLSADISRDKLTELLRTFIESGGLFTDVADDVMKAAKLYLSYQSNLTVSTNSLVESERSLNDIRQELMSTYGRERSELESTISRFKNISSTLRDFKNSLALGELSPLSPAQKLEEARAEFNRTRALASQGDQSALEALPKVSQEFLQASQTYNASSAAFISDFNLVKGVLDNASNSALSQSEIAQNQLDKLKSTVEYLTDIDDKAKTTNDLLEELLVATLKGGGNSSISSQDIKSFLANNPGMSAQQIANAATKFGVSKDQLVSAGIKESDINKYTGGKTVTDQQIIDFVNANRNNPRAIYDAAIANGISSTRLSAVTGISKTDIDKFVKDNRLQSFAKGTDFVAKSGLAMVHRAEAIVPSSTTDEVKKMREELTKLRQEQNQQTGDLMRVIDISDHKNAKLIADALSQIERQRVWNDRAKAGLR